MLALRDGRQCPSIDVYRHCAWPHARRSCGRNLDDGYLRRC